MEQHLSGCGKDIMARPNIGSAIAAASCIAVLWLSSGGVPSQASVPGGAATGLRARDDAVAPALRPRAELAKPQRVVQPEYEHRLTVKFRDDIRARTDVQGRVVSAAGVGPIAIADLGDVRFSPLINLSQERIEHIESRAAVGSGIAQPDLAGMMIIEAPHERLQEIADALLASPLTEWVYFEELIPPPPGWVDGPGHARRPLVARNGDDRHDGSALLTPCVDIPPVTPNYFSLQIYHGPDPGLNMAAAWQMAAARGAGIKIADCEYWFNGDHEDLCDIIAEPGQTPHPQIIINGWDEHGTAVFGELVAAENDYGCTGLVPDAQAYFFPEWTVEEGSRRVTAIANAIATMGVGDVVLLEMQTIGPGGNYAPAELNPAVWQVTRAGTDGGVIVVAAAGNGNQDLDSPPYDSYRSWGDSGAIIVGAGSSTTAHNKLGFSTYGSRVNVQGWGQNVFTLGYGSYAQHGGDKNQRYTASFSGTSSASPFVAAAVAALQSASVDLLGTRLSPAELREILIQTGIPQGSGGHIGPFPDMVAALNVLADFGAVNACETAPPITDGLTTVNNTPLSTTGPAETCFDYGDDQVHNDVWHRYVATCTGLLTVRLCQSNVHTKLALYADVCPGGLGEAIACDVISCPSTLRSQVSTLVQTGRTYYIRAGGHGEQTGQIVIDISCEPGPIGDLNGDGAIDVLDLLILIDAWGECDVCGDCPADLNGDCAVDVSDMLILLDSWG
jgi:subtilisin family serine protease